MSWPAGVKNCASGSVDGKNSLNCRLSSPPPAMRLLAQALRQTHARTEVVNRVHRPRIVDVVASTRARCRACRAARCEAPGRGSWLSLVVPFQSNTRSHQKNCAPTFELRFAHAGFSGLAGGLTGFGPTWQNAHDMPMRYGLHELVRQVIARVAVVALRVPVLAGPFVEVRIGEQRSPTMPEGSP